MIENSEEIERLCHKYPIVDTLWKEYTTLYSDPSVEFASAVTFAAREIAKYTKNKELNVSDDYHKSLIALLNDSEKMYKGINTSMGKTTTEKVEEEKPRPKAAMKHIERRD